MNASVAGQMRIRRRTRRYVCALALLALTCANCRTRQYGALDSPRAAQLPPVMLWAWEQPARLNFLDARATGVAYLAATLRLRMGDVTLVPRMQPLEVPHGVLLLAVVRIERDRREAAAPSYDDAQRARIVREVVAVQDAPGVRGVQIDFDAQGSEREFYRALLDDLRRALPPDKMLTMTALASWCAGDNWLDGLPVDEAVPMLFRMGADTKAVLMRLADGRDFSSAICRHSYGVAVDENIVPPNFLNGRRRYVFNGKAWTRDSVTKALNGVEP
ncbi:MAG: hypothetical protein WCD76_12700 [Pyrinomonadaceae bacterium]